MNSNYLMNNYGTRDLSIVKGEGSWLWDDQGNRYLDAVMGIAVCSLGHAHPEIAEVLAEQSKKLVHCSNLFLIPEQQELAAKLCSVTGMTSTFFCNSGAEANEAAIKLSRLYARKKGVDNPTVITTHGAFHGRTLATISASGSEKVQKGFEPLVQDFIHVPYNDIEAVAVHKNNDSVVAVMVEPVQGEAGVVIPDAGYLRTLRKICDDNDWLLILDEVQTGNGRTGSYFASVGASVKPDVLTTAKGLGNGLPIGACLAGEKAAELFAPGSHGTTFGGNPLVCAVANKVFDIIERDHIAANASQIGNFINESLAENLADTASVLEVRNAGLMIGIEMDKACGELVGIGREHGILINVTGGNRVRLLPALNMTREDADFLIDRLTKTIKQWEKS